MTKHEELAAHHPASVRGAMTSERPGPVLPLVLRTPLGRLAAISEIAEAVYFLASDKSAKSTGNIINVDAGNAAAFTR